MQINAVGLKKAFGEKQVLDGFSHVFRDGTVTAVMGPSGCGKSTLISILMGILTQDSGEVLHETPFRRSALFQENRLCENLTAAANIRLVTGKLRSEKEITEALNSVMLHGIEKKPVRELSGGMKRRVALLRALLAEYDVLFLDEPFKGLDEVTRTCVMEYTRRMIQGKTVIMVTHDKDECEFLADEVITMEQI